MKNKIKFAKSIFRLIPSNNLKNYIFKKFCRFISGRKDIICLNGIYFDLDFNEVIDLALYLDNFEPDVVSAIDLFCLKNMVVLDIGANIGAHTFHMAKNIGEQGKLLAFEPTTFAYNKLQRNEGLNSFKNIDSMRVALGTENLVNQTINFRSSWRTDCIYQEASCKVDFYRLDDLLKIKNITTVDFIKIDVDGHEYEVLLGGVEMLKCSKPIVLMEAIGLHFQSMECSPFSLLENMGYSFVRLNPKDLPIKIAYLSAFEIEALLPQ